MTFASHELDATTEHGAQVWRSRAKGPCVVAVAGPPTSALLFRHLARPLADAGRSLVLPELFHPPGRSSTVDALVDRIEPFLGDDAVLVVHGLALPIGFAAAARRPLRRLVVLDGPLERLDPVSRAAASLATASRGLVAGLLAPAWSIPALASSAALRRTVVNPYAMDRDIVAMLSAPVLATSAHRRAVAEFLASIAHLGPPWRAGRTPVRLVWSASNLLYPLPRSPERLIEAPAVEAKSLPGARFYSVEERPWEVAAAIVEGDLPASRITDRDTDVTVSRSERRRGKKGAA